MKPISLISSDLFDTIRSRFTNLEMGNENGMVTLDPNVARFFDFDFDVEGNNLGRVSISLNEPGNLKIFYSQGILEETSSLIQERWFNFLRRMRKFAKRRLLRFDTRDITKSNLKKEDFKFLANQKKENTMNESAIYGSSLSSFLPLEKTLLIIRHNQPVGLTRGDRSRRIKSIFIQNGEGERFKMPINCLRTARAMQRHCANGGRPYDNIGNTIIQIGSEASQLRDFKRRCKMDSMQETAHTIVEKALEKYESLKDQLESACSQSGYENFKLNAGTHNVDEVIVDESTLQQYREKFSHTVFREDLSQYFPLLEKIMREAGEVDLTQLTNEQVNLEAEKTAEPKDDFKDFEKWANNTEEGFLSDDIIKELKNYLSPEPDVGVDGTDAIKSLENIFDGEIDDDLEKRIKEVAPSGDTRTVVISWLSSRDDGNAIKELNEEPPAEEGPKEEEPAEEPSPSPAETAATPPEGETPPALPPPEGETPLPAPQPTAESRKPPKTRIRKIAEMVKSFYNQEAAEQGNGPWTIGETAVKRKVKKKFGKSAAKLAEQLINELTERHNQKVIEKDTTFEDILRLSGIKNS